VWPLLKWGTLVLLPFVVLVRGGLFVHHQGAPVPVVVGAGFLAAGTVLMGYAGWAHRRLTGALPVRAGVLKRQAIAVLVAMTVLQGYVLWTPDAAHVQSAAVRAEYSRLHPLLRTGVALLLLADDDLLITDLSRHPDDYAEMGLPVHPRSSHYPQPDGYVYAMDLRTRGRSMLRNGLVQGYFEVLGFRTLRHVGTADHLHVALPRPRGQDGRP
jgi:hypothetical protein